MSMFDCFSTLLVSLLSVCGAGGIACMFIQMPLLQVCSFIAFMSCGMAVNIVNAATVDLYPTSSRYLVIFVRLFLYKKTIFDEFINFNVDFLY